MHGMCVFELVVIIPVTIKKTKKDYFSTLFYWYKQMRIFTTNFSSHLWYKNSGFVLLPIHVISLKQFSLITQVLRFTIPQQQRQLFCLVAYIQISKIAHYMIHDSQLYHCGRKHNEQIKSQISESHRIIEVNNESHRIYR